jgi:hypothetical protein
MARRSISKGFIARFLAHDALIGARRCSSAKRRAAFSSLADSDPRATRSKSTTSCYAGEWDGSPRPPRPAARRPGGARAGARAGARIRLEPAVNSDLPPAFRGSPASRLGCRCGRDQGCRGPSDPPSLGHLHRPVARRRSPPPPAASSPPPPPPGARAAAADAAASAALLPVGTASVPAERCLRRQRRHR